MRYISRRFFQWLFRNPIFSIHFFILALLSVDAAAQIPLGFKVGVNFNRGVIREHGDVYHDWQLRSETGYHLGVFTRLKLSNKISFVPELQFAKKRAFDMQDGSKSYHMYLEMPLLFSYQPVSWISIQAGGSLGLNLYEIPEATFKKYDAGLLGGLQFNLTKKFSVGARYFYGLIPFSTVRFAGTNVKFGYFNEDMYLYLSYYLK